MPQTVQTNLTIALQTKGFDKGLREILGVSQSAIDGLKKQATQYTTVQDKIKGMQKKIQELAKEQLSASRAMEKIGDKASDAYKKHEKAMEDAGDKAKKFREQIKLLEQAHKSDADAQNKLIRGLKELSREQEKNLALQKQAQQQGRWAGTQGFFQGMGMGGMAGLFMQRGPGFWRQFAGQRVGGLFRRAGGVAGGIAQTPFGGIQGLQQALAAIPGVGGIAAGQLGAVAGFSQQALQYQQERLGVAPYVQTVGTPGQVAAQTDINTRLASVRAAERNLKTFGRGVASKRLASERSRHLEAISAGMLSGEGEAPGFFAKPLEMAGARVAAEKRQELTAKRQRLEAARREAFLASPLGQIQTAGRELLGVGRQQAMQQLGQLFQVAGGTYTGGAAQQQEMKTAFAAQTMFGVGPETAGAFLMGGRRGGLAGGMGRGADAMREALQDAMEMGLEGSEITNYMQQVATGIQQFQQTGIPFNKDSIKVMAGELSKAGIGGVRGTTMAQGFNRYVQTMGQRQMSGMDLLLLQIAGGYKGGGPQEFEKALVDVELMSKQGKGGIEKGSPMGEFAKRILNMSGGAYGGGISRMRGAFEGMGISMSQTEAAIIAERLTGKTILTPEQRKAAEGAGVLDIGGETARAKTGAKAASKIDTMEQLVAVAAKRVTDMAPNLKMQADIMNKQLDIGNQALTAVQLLEISSSNVNESFIKLAGPTLENFSASLAKVTKQLETIIKEGGGVGDVLKLIFG